MFYCCGVLLHPFALYSFVLLCSVCVSYCYVGTVWTQGSSVSCCSTTGVTR